MKKCIVLDLDNTLWGGVVGEDGLDGIQLSVAPPGGYFVAFQQALLDLYHRGIILAVNSQNNHDDAMEVILKHPNMILKQAHFAAYRMNWNDKVQNLRELADELNIGLDSMVFLDDSPTNRQAVRSFLPEVETPEVPADPADYAKFLMSLPYFQSEAITNEDAMRGNMYVTERLRKEAEKSFENKADFLRSLGLEVTVTTNDALSAARIAQLSDKTNQFNTNKQPMDSEQVKSYMKNPDYRVFSGRVTDRFGDYGITAVALVHAKPDRWHIESFLLSCRVIGRGVEETFLYAVAQEALKSGAESLKIDFVPTEKNKPAKDFVGSMFDKGVVAAKKVGVPDWITFHHEKI